MMTPEDLWYDVTRQLYYYEDAEFTADGLRIVRKYLSPDCIVKNGEVFLLA